VLAEGAAEGGDGHEAVTSCVEVGQVAESTAIDVRQDHTHLAVKRQRPTR
jgi:hypothetical protein